MNADTLLGNFEVLAEAPDGLSRLRLLIIELAIRGRFSKAEKVSSRGFPFSWDNRPASEFFESRSGNSKLIKGKLFNEFAQGRYAGYSASGQDVWLDSAEHSGEAAILSAVGARCGKAFRASGSWSAIANTHIIWLNDKRVEPDYGMLILNNEKFWIRSGSAQPFVKVKASLEQTIGIPPLAEQKRIVAKVDEFMALCDQLEQQQRLRDNLRTATRKSSIDAISTATTPEELEAAWKRINNNWDVIADTPESIDSLRELILDLAVRGDLGITDISDAKAPTLWDVEEQKLDVDKLWKLDTMHVNPANGWSRLPLARLGTWGSGGTPTASRKEFYNNGSIPWAVIGDLNNGIMTDTSSKITEKALASSSAKLIPKNAVLIAMYGASIGKTAVTGIECTTNQAIAHCIVDESVVSTEYFFLVAKSLKKHLIKVGKGAAQPNISQTVLKHLLIDVPQLNAQQIVVSKVNEFMALCDQLEARLKVRSEVAEKFARSVVNAA